MLNKDRDEEADAYKYYKLHLTEMIKIMLMPEMWYQVNIKIHHCKFHVIKYI